SCYDLMLCGQTIDYATNAPRIGDVCKRQQVEYFNCGNGGHDVIWDFRGLSATGKVDVTYYLNIGDSVLAAADSERMCKYTLINDTLRMVGYETPLIEMSYSVPQICMTYPFDYGHGISNCFDGQGKYCGELLMHHCGTMIVEADAEGSVMVADGDTLCNVIRVHTLSTNSLGMYAATDTLLSDSSNVKQEIEEKYSWYVRGYRYPMYETVCVSYYDKMNPVSSIRKAYRYLPDNQSFLKDSVNERMLMEDSLALENGLDVFRYGVEYCNGTLKVVYDADIDVSIDALVCNKQGVLYMRKKECQLAGSDYQMTFDCTGLRNDEYILYMNVNGKVYSEKFQVR
ncbi:MAG: hypothetical protein IJR86_05405, partial [Bacteroidaceae bacterium]|nr:hypothetical protein [Bacteroidaceae bacterium]